MYLIGYTISLFVFQLTLTTLLIHKNVRYAQYVFSLMVPMTLASFEIGVATLDSNIMGANGENIFHIYDWLGIVGASISVFLFNFFEEKPQKTLIEHI